MMSKSIQGKSEEGKASPFVQTYFHGTRADLRVGDLLGSGHSSNYRDKPLKHTYVSATLHAAIWGAELALGDGKERIYLVEPLGKVEDDPNVTDKKFQGNPTMSYRSEKPFRVIGEVTIWQSHSAEEIRAMKEGIAHLKNQHRNSIEE